MLKQARADLERSGIDLDAAEFAELFSVKDASTVFEDFKKIPGLIIPYYDPWTDEYLTFERDGEPQDFCRVRYYPEPSRVEGFGKKRKTLRYSQPVNSGLHPYFPLVEGVDWVEIADDPEVPVMITEGEKKALRATLAGIPTIGLGGVYNFATDGELLPVLDRFEWSQRPVYICYDSDAANNSKIQVAEGRLATELSMKRNASIFLVRLPELPGGAKVGVDDFLVREGDAALFDLLEDAPEMRRMDKEVMRLNAEAAWIEREGLVLDLRTDTWLKKSDFVKGSEFSARTVMVPKDRGNGVRYVSVADTWLTHPHARRYTDTVFRPGTTDKAIRLEGGGVAYNRFRGLEGVEGDVEPFFDLYDWLMSRTDEFDYDLIWKTIAYKMQNLEASVDLGIILLGPQGSGKSMFCNTVAEMVAPYNKIMSSNELGSDFNGWIETSLIVVMNESKATQLRYNMERLRTYITDRTQPMNEKYRASRQVQNYALYLFNSNERNAGAFPDDDRRMIVLGCPGKHPDGDKFYGPIAEWIDKGGAKKLLHFFQHYDLEGWKPPRWAPETREKRMAYHASLSPIQRLGDDILRAKGNVVALWIQAALDWAASDAVGGTPTQAALAATISQTLVHMQIRPFYTPEELSLIFPGIASTLQYGKVRDAAPVNVLAQELIQMGVGYLRNEDNLDGFMHKGRIKQYLVIADHDEWDEPITQDEFDDLMSRFPSYNEWRMSKRNKKRRRKD